MQVSVETAQRFGASDSPLGIVVDHAGVIRFIGVLPDDAFNGSGYIVNVISRIAGKRVNLPVGK